MAYKNVQARNNSYVAFKGPNAQCEDDTRDKGGRHDNDASDEE